jgi:hypothetical protein
MSREDVNELLAKALDSPDIRRALLQVSREKASRPVRSCRCEVVEISEAAQTHDFADITPGTVTAFVGREGEPLLRDLTEAIAADNSEGFNVVTDQIKGMLAELTRKIAEASTHAVSPRQTFPSFVEISYANKTLTSQVYADEVLRVHWHAFVYNGGYLDKRAFSMVEYYLAGSDAPLTCVFVIRQPKLGEIEREALRLVPSAASANNIGAVVVQPVTPALVAFVGIAAEAAARFVYNEFVALFVAFLHGGTTALASIPDAVLEGEDFQTMLESLPPEVTAAELVRLRTDMLLQSRAK